MGKYAINIQVMELITGENDKMRRLDRILRKALPDHPLALIHRLLRQGQVFINGKPARAQDRVDNGMIISIPSLKDIKKVTIAQNCNICSPDIIWEDAGLLAVNKPVGITVHGKDSLDTMVQSYLTGKLPLSLSFKPGPLHRLDKPSSGIVVFSKSLQGARIFTSLMKELKVKKTYLTIVEGTIKSEEIWQDILFRDKEKKKTFVSTNRQSTFGKIAITKVIPLAAKNGYSLIQAEITTGRTHQIRAQAATHKFPLAGDLKYGSKKLKNSPNQNVSFFLHAWKLEFLDHLIKAPLPEVFKDRISTFKSLDLLTLL
jgi:23S rRNA pseudouridine955/2504/2580 synthase